MPCVSSGHHDPVLWLQRGGGSERPGACLGLVSQLSWFRPLVLVPISPCHPLLCPSVVGTPQMSLQAPKPQRCYSPGKASCWPLLPSTPGLENTVPRPHCWARAGRGLRYQQGKEAVCVSSSPRAWWPRLGGQLPFPSAHRWNSLFSWEVPGVGHHRDRPRGWGGRAFPWVWLPLLLRGKQCCLPRARRGGSACCRHRLPLGRAPCPWGHREGDRALGSGGRSA